MSNIIERVETFIQRLHNMDYIIAQEATKIWYTIPSSDPYDRLFPRQSTLADCLAKAMSSYQGNRDNKKHKLSYARTFLLWIDRALASGVIQEGKGLVSRNKELESVVKRLQKLLDKCNKRRQTLEKENKRLHTLVPNTFTGDLQGE